MNQLYGNVLQSSIHCRVCQNMPDRLIALPSLADMARLRPFLINSNYPKQLVRTSKLTGIERNWQARVCQHVFRMSAGEIPIFLRRGKLNTTIEWEKENILKFSLQRSFVPHGSKFSIN